MLTASQVKTLKPKLKLYTVNDGAGLSIQVTPAGAKRWMFRYRFNNKPMHKSLGKYPEISLAKAREKRDEARRALAEGNDPFELTTEKIIIEPLDNGLNIT